MSDSIIEGAKLRPDPGWGIPPRRDWIASGLVDLIFRKVDRLPRLSAAVETDANAQIATCLQNIYVRYFNGALRDRCLAEREKPADDLKRGFSLESSQGRNEARKLRAVTKRMHDQAKWIEEILQINAKPLFGSPQPREFPVLHPASRRRMTRAVKRVIEAGGEELARFKIELAAAYARGELSPAKAELCAQLGVLEIDFSRPSPYELKIRERERFDAELAAIRNAMPRGGRITYTGHRGRPRRLADREAAEGIRDLLTYLRGNRPPGKRVNSFPRRKTLLQQTTEKFFEVADPFRLDETKQPYDAIENPNGAIAYYRDLPGADFYAAVAGR